ncbi:cell division protein FtsW [Flavobacterium branchiophilum NBRC 15030 = ATCC 35035]|uniref:Probable peptidoglycan glycosyltransferase FtsW n=1 Tax=Flavobacterium branchiophilum TaxID=55197 RepID=A0A543G555_9FLAO|nr:FtsW/RodA/SpoVE family cell cycle protein [Flavobacterium branchiophilum]OXA78099.1 cell division protein FtsW [Flavobacterium branchiophilum NBRC 15030 = ATCC 35035]TQM41216.1 cell division protein FtsW [Flavobacterium branchiophilum]GEM54427.1 cell division protein FtsW [Flavobacterium branchiophilum NBRC 15030 = ATCC 35035]
MKKLISKLKGDKGIWSFVALLGIFSFMPVFSASSNLAYMNHGTGSTIGYLISHLVHIFLGFIIIFWVQKVPYHYYRGLSKFALIIVWFLLVYTLLNGTVIAGANASRWIKIPFVGITFQTSTLASIVLMVFVARYLAKNKDVAFTFRDSFIDLWIPVGITLMLILPANLSTAALIFAMVLMLTYVGHYPLKYLGIILGSGFLFLVSFMVLAKTFPNAFPNRVDTWISRIENFTTDKPGEDDYQIEKAKIAIASGTIYGLGPGKSVQKHFLPQSSSDFIYAIIVEEYGMIGGLGILFIYMLLFFRFIVAAQKANSFFGKLLVIGLGFPMIFQAIINMGVAVELFPVTGQPLPLVSSGGSSIWMTCIALGIILSVTKKEEEIIEELKEKERREASLKRLIDEQIVKENEDQLTDYDIVDTSENPMNPILNPKKI